MYLIYDIYDIFVTIVNWTNLISSLLTRPSSPELLSLTHGVKNVVKDNSIVTLTWTKAL